MARKYDFISELYNRTCKTVVANPASWEAFLRSACYNYRLRFDEQLLVHAQRPDATAVLQIDDWNQKFGRWVNRGAHGIAVFEDADQRRQRLVHYFDISDTHPSRFSRRVPIWQMRDEYTAEVIDTLESTFGELNDKCHTCGYEWKAVVKARVKGGMCPVCAERAVLQGYNDLGTTDPHLLSEWDYEKNSKWTPSNVSRNSMKVVWWKCGAGHSYRAKITDRTIEQKGCPQCEAEFQQALPQMLIMMYGAQNGITVKSNSDSELGMRLVAYLPELHCAVDIAGATVTEKREQSVKAHICQSNRLGYYLIKRTADTSQMAAEIKTLFIRNHIYLHTDSEKDVQVLRARFLEWKNRNACKLN